MGARHKILVNKFCGNAFRPTNMHTRSMLRFFGGMCFLESSIWTHTYWVQLTTGMLYCVFFLKKTRITKLETMKNENYCAGNSKLWKMNPKLNPNGAQRRPNGPLKATNGAQWRSRSAPMDPQRWQKKPQWPSKGTHGSPRDPKDHRRQAKRAQWNLKLKRMPYWRPLGVNALILIYLAAFQT